MPAVNKSRHAHLHTFRSNYAPITDLDDNNYKDGGLCKMLTFYRNAAIASVMLLVISAILFYIGFLKSQITASLFPLSDQSFFWKSSTEPAQPKGKNYLTLKTEVGNVEYEFALDPECQFPYAHYSLYFADAIHLSRQIDLTRYDSVSFRMMCDPKKYCCLYYSALMTKSRT